MDVHELHVDKEIYDSADIVHTFAGQYKAWHVIVWSLWNGTVRYSFICMQRTAIKGDWQIHFAPICKMTEELDF